MATSIDSACERLRRGGRNPLVLTALYSEADERLTCVVTAANTSDVRDIFEIALLPPARVSEVVELLDTRPNRDGG